MTASEFVKVTDDPKLAGIEHFGAHLDPYAIGERGDFREWCNGCFRLLDRGAYYVHADDRLAHQAGTAKGYCSAECGDRHR